MRGFTFNEFEQQANPVRAPLDSKPITFWGCELGGEAGEVCNVAKKIERDGESAELDDRLIDEAGDTLLALSWVLRKRGLSLNQAAEFALEKLEQIASEVNA